MSSVIDLYEKLAEATDDKARAKILAEAFEALAERYPNLAETATRRDLSETELHLLKEIEQTRLEIEQIRADLTTKIEEVRTEHATQIEQVRADLTTKIEEVRADLVDRLAQTKVEIIRWVAGLLVAQGAAIVWVVWRATAQ